MNCNSFVLVMGLFLYVDITAMTNSSMTSTPESFEATSIEENLNSSNRLQPDVLEKKFGFKPPRKRNCKWKLKARECGKDQLDFLFDCNRENTTVEQELKKFPRNEIKRKFKKSNCNRKNLNELCKICIEFEWSPWSECCSDEICFIKSRRHIIGNYTKYRRARYSRINPACRDTFGINSACSFDISSLPCKTKNITGRIALKPGAGDNGNHSLFSLTTKFSIFAVAGVIMIGLFGFAGLRLLRTVGRQPSRRRSQLSASRQSSSQMDTQYSNVSFRNDPQSPSNQDQQFLMVNSSRTYRMAPFNRLSIIQEEDDGVLSVSNQEVNTPKSESMMMKMESNPALDYMDGIINQIEDEERAFELEDENYRSSVAREESFKLLNQFGWDPNARKNNPDRIERLKPCRSDEVLINSDLSLASATLLQPTDDTTSLATSSTSENEADCYSLRDISDHDSPNWKRQFASEPDLTRSNHIIPDIADVLTDSDFDVNQINERV